MINEAHKSVEFIKSKLAKHTEVDSRDAARMDWQRQVINVFWDLGFRSVGAGKYGLVFTKEGYPYAIKFFMRDTAYLRWLQFCMANPNNPYLPKIKGRVVKVGKVFMAIRLEKLIEPRNQRELNATQDLIWMGQDPEDTLESGKADKWQEQICHELIRNSKLKDVHHGNVMTRPSTGEAVLFDAYYNWYKGNYTVDPDDLASLKTVF